MLSHLNFGYFDLVNPVDQVNHVSQGSDWKIQHGLYLFHSCPGPILQFQFWEFSLGSPKKWLLSLNYWLDDHFLFQMAVWLVLLEQSSVNLPQFASWKELRWIYQFPKIVPTKNELEKNWKKSIWPPESKKWLGILVDDVSQHLRQSSSSSQSADVWIILLWLSQ